MEGVCVCLSVCPSIISTTVHPIDVTLGRCIAEDPRTEQACFEQALH